MDTGTHLVIGLGLAGLAYIDPVVAADSTVSTAVLIGTVLGSQAPDSDGIMRLKGNAAYIKNHRGASHSLPAIGIWTLLITSLLCLFFRDLPVLHVGMWVLIAVCVHVFTDLFNTYGTQGGRPFTDKWISWNIIHIFDPIIFCSHLVAIFLWSTHLAEPDFIFPALYISLAGYYIWRTITHYVLQSGLYRKDLSYERGEKYILIPTVNLYVWNIVKRRNDGTFMLGELRNNHLKWIDHVSCDCHPAVEASKAHPDIAAFLYYSSYACAEIKNHPWGYEVRWADVRYRHRRQYPFVAVVLMDRSYEPMDSYVGWVSESRLEKKLRAGSY
ncbi:MAG: metal-dependent hydrolase [Paenibacillaceae bacterium]|nr:metal-dependent hydrolase [Paenibacillaceae bacterium]